MRFRSAVLLLALCLAVPASLAARQDAPKSPRNANYSLEVTLDPANHLLVGRGRLTWRNPTSQPATELRFHLYWNAWRDESSSWMREAQIAGRAPLAGRTDADRGFIDISSLTIVGAPDGANLMARARFIAPDDGNGRDRTVLAVPLDAPVAAGGTIALDVAWSAHVPRPFDRTGVIGRTYFLAQWFPKIGVFDDDGWHCHQFHASTEFFADFGRYDVRMTVPGGWIVGATGAEISQTANANGSVTHRYVQDDVHDFAWTTSPEYLDWHDRFEEPGLPPVALRLLLQPEHVSQADRHFTAAKAALRAYGRALGPYPWKQLTIVDPVAVVDPDAQGANIGAMEYPTLITAGTRWLEPWSAEDPEAVVVHEVAHQFWYGVVATDEVEHAWMDEGIATFTAARVVQEAFPGRFKAVHRYFGGLVAWPFADVPWTEARDGYGLDVYRDTPGRDVPATPSWQYDPSTAAITTYARTSLWLATLERLVGRETMGRLLAAYYARGAFRHPTPDEFFAIASEESGRDLAWFFDAVYRSAATFDYAVGSVISTPIETGAFDTTVVVERRAAGVFPVDVQVTFDDGASVVERWDGREASHPMRFRRAAKAATVEIDPDRVLMLDVLRTNNSWTARPQGARAADKWSLRWLSWFQHVLLTYAFFA
jgi:hypothetical protein